MEPYFPRAALTLFTSPNPISDRLAALRFLQRSGRCRSVRTSFSFTGVGIVEIRKDFMFLLEFVEIRKDYMFLSEMQSYGRI